MNPLDVVLIIFIIVVAIGAGLYFLNKWATKKMGEQQSVIERTRQTVTLYVIDKKRDKVTNAKLPKAAIEQMPRLSKLMKMYFVQAKVGPQILTLMCDKKVFNAIPTKKNVKVGLAGIYIVDMVGMKSEKQMKEEKKAKKAAQSAENPSVLDKVKNVFKKNSKES